MRKLTGQSSKGKLQGAGPSFYVGPSNIIDLDKVGFQGYRWSMKNLWRSAQILLVSAKSPGEALDTAITMAVNQKNSGLVFSERRLWTSDPVSAMILVPIFRSRQNVMAVSDAKEGTNFEKC